MTRPSIFSFETRAKITKMDRMKRKPAKRTKSDLISGSKKGSKDDNKKQLAGLKGLKADAAEYRKQNDAIFSLSAENKILKNQYINAYTTGKQYQREVVFLSDELNAAKEANRKLHIEIYSERVISYSAMQILNDEKRKMDKEKADLQVELEIVAKELVTTKQQHEQEMARAEKERENNFKENERLTKSVDEYKLRLEARELEAEIDLEREKVEARTKYGRTIMELKTENGALKRQLVEAEKNKEESTKAAERSSLRMFSVLAVAVAVFSIWRPLRI